MSSGEGLTTRLEGVAMEHARATGDISILEEVYRLRLVDRELQHCRESEQAWKEDAKAEAEHSRSMAEAYQDLTSRQRQVLEQLWQMVVQLIPHFKEA